jgi:CelD/BcsL family acetyltransferase involved in cellulose biosynthesis
MVLVQAAQIFRDKALRPGEWTLDTVGDAAGFAALEGPWNALVERAGIDHPFVRHEWMRAWWDAFGAGRELHIVTIRSRDELIAIAPFMITRGRMYGVPVRRLELIFNVHTPRLEIITGRAHREVYRALWKYLREHGGRWDVAQLHQLPEGSRTLEELRRVADEDGFPSGVWRSDDSPYLSLEGISPDVYFASLGSKHRSNMRNRTKRLAKLGTIAVETVSGGPALDRALDEGFAIEAAAWKGTEQTAIASDDALRRFYTRLAHVAAKTGWLRLSFLTLDGRRIAFGYSLVYGRKLYLLKAGYDPEFAPYSPFNLLCERVIREAFEQGLTEFDFLGKDAEWKLKWTRTTRPHYWLFIFSRDLRARFIHWAKFRLAASLREKSVMRPLVRWARGETAIPGPNGLATEAKEGA